MLAAPLLAGNDLRDMTPAIQEILTNREVIAIDQDKAGKQGKRVSQSGDQEVWTRPLSDGGLAIGMFNRGAAPEKMSVKWAEIGWKKKPKTGRDLWAHSEVKIDGAEYTATVPAHGVVMLKVM